MFDFWKGNWALAPVSCNFSYFRKILSFNSFRLPSQLAKQLGYNIFILDVMYLFSFGESTSTEILKCFKILSPQLWRP